MSGPIVVLQVLPDLATGGGQQVVRRLISAMDRERVRHHVAIFGPPHDMLAEYEAAGAVVHDLGAWRPVLAIQRLAALRSLARDVGARVIHVHGTPVDKLNGQIVAIMEGLPVVWSLHGMRPVLGLPQTTRRGLLRWVRQLLAGVIGGWLDRFAADTVVAVSDAVAVDWEPHLARRRRRASVIYSGIPVDDFAKASSPEELRRRREALGLPPSAPTLIAVARLHPGKRMDLSIDALSAVRRRLPEARLLVVGDGSERAALESHAARCGCADHVIFLGRRDDVPALLEISDVMLFTSEAEGFGLVALEALASGTPVVSTRLPSLERVAQEIDALKFVDRQTPDALAEAVIGLYAEPTRVTPLGAAAREAVRGGWDVSLAASRYADLYEEVVRE